jgi:hypothetical protein
VVCNMAVVPFLGPPNQVYVLGRCREPALELGVRQGDQRFRALRVAGVSCSLGPDLRRSMFWISPLSGTSHAMDKPNFQSLFGSMPGSLCELTG